MVRHEVAEHIYRLKCTTTGVFSLPGLRSSFKGRSRLTPTDPVTILYPMGEFPEKQGKEGLMDSESLRSFFGWCSIVNGVLFLVSVGIYQMAGPWVRASFSKMYGLDDARVGVIYLQSVALYKILWIFLNVVPWIVLVLMKS
ncbi:MAG: hypothetical protein MZV63_63655 [Marinilabiliales bacterium]|nr:hypothetical protein [Marinilabiliales bacterium]